MVKCICTVLNHQRPKPGCYLSRSVAATASGVLSPTLYSILARAPFTPVISVSASTCTHTKHHRNTHHETRPSPAVATTPHYI